MRFFHDWGSQIGVSWANFRQGITINVWLSLLGLAAITPLIWCFDLVGGRLNNTVLNLMYAAIPLLLFLDAKSGKPESRRLNLVLLALVAVLTVALMIAVGEEYELVFLTVNGSMLFVSLPALFIFLKMIWMKPLLGFGIVPAMALAVFYLVMWEIPPEKRIDYVLVPFPIVLLIGVILALVGWWLLSGAERFRQRPTRGPMMESLSMLFLFLPLIVLAIVIPGTFPNGETWSAVFGTIVGVLFSSVVSVPLRQFLLDWGKLPPNRSWEGCGDAEIKAGLS